MFSTALLADVLNQTRDAIVIAEYKESAPQRVIVSWVNDAFVELSGYQREDIIGQSPKILHGPQTDMVVIDTINDHVKQRKSVKAEICNYRKDGRDYWIEVNIAPMSHKEGDPEYFVSIQRNITERKQQETLIETYVQDLKKSQELLTKRNSELTAERNRAETSSQEAAHLLKHLAEKEFLLAKSQEMAKLGTWRWNIKADTLEWTDQVSKMFGLGPGITSASISDFIHLIHPEDQHIVRGAIDNALTGEPYAVDHRVIMPDGQVNIIHETGSVVSDEMGEPYEAIGTTQDVTAQRSAEKELRIAKEDAEAANVAKSSFLAMMSHELRTPMNGVLGFIQIMLMDPNRNEQDIERLELVRHSANALLRILNDILDLAKLESGSLEFIDEPFDPKEEFRVSAQRWSMDADQKGFDFSLKFDQMPSQARGDKARICQVLDNIIGNAMKYTDKGFVSVHIGLERGGGHGDQLRFTVEDSGIGMSQETIRNLFDPFFRSTDQSVKTREGVGLGMAICEKIVNQLGGNIAVESEENKGSKFTFITPINVVEVQVEGSGARSDGDENCADVVKGRVLIVEDNEINRTVITHLIEAVGLHFEIAENGQIAIDKLKETEFDLILMDINMPVMDGLTATKHIRTMPENVRSIPVIAVTAHAMKSDAQRFLSSGFDGYLPKPLEYNALCDVLDEFLSDSQITSRSAAS